MTRLAILADLHGNLPALEAVLATEPLEQKLRKLARDGKFVSVTARERLAALERTNDGFQIAELDLRLRGPGEFLGIRFGGVVGTTNICVVGLNSTFAYVTVGP